MKRARIIYQGNEYTVVVNEDMSVVLPDGSLKREEEVIWLPPSNGVMYALGLNYADHASELSFTPPEKPLIFVKTPGTFIGHNNVGYRPDNVTYMHYECELTAVIGRQASQVSRDEAWDYVEGFTLCNDYAIRDYLENYYRPNLRVKNRYHMTPVGPYIIDRASVKDPDNLVLRTWVNGELRLEGNTKDMIFDIPFLIEYISQYITLNPGDMIATGCPKGTSDVGAGDEVTVEIEGIGRLTHTLLTEDAFHRDR